MTSAVTGRQYQIGAGPYRATVTGLGAGLRELLFGDQPVIAGYDADELPPGGAGQLLAPWPNRIDGGRYVFGGTEFQLALSEPEHANAIHGLTRWLAWTPVRHDADAVVLRAGPHGQQGYPFCLQIDAEYRLDPGSGLHVAITAANRGSHAAPYGTGSHPFTNPHAPKGPTYMPEYIQPELAQASTLNARASNYYALVGISGHFRVRAARIALISVGGVILAFSCILLVLAPRPPV